MASKPHGRLAQLEPRLYVLVLAPYVLFLVPFRLAWDMLIQAMAIVSLALGASSLALSRYVRGQLLALRGFSPASVILYTAALYLAFIAGRELSKPLGLYEGVPLVYSSLRGGLGEYALIPVIGVMEEVYWRGFIQGQVITRSLGLPWWLSAVLYSAAHIPSGIPLLVPAALVAGLILGHAMKSRGLLTAAVAHVAWLYLVLYVFPLA